RTNGAVERAFSAGFFHDNANGRADGHPVRFHSFKLKFQPVITVARIQEKLVWVVVRLHGAADHGIDVLITVVIDIAERNSVSLLQHAESSRGGDFLESTAAIIAKHAIGNERGEIGIPGATV